ncbi:MAG: SpoIID/LytB domain-containing protein [Deltaproteobacteria bacterium]
MRLAVSSFLFGYSLLLLGLTTNSGRNEAFFSYSNTPIRVLLDKGQQEIRVQSVLNHLFIKEPGATKWSEFPKNSIVRLSRSRKQLWINNIPFKSSAIYLRGGNQHTDPIQYGKNFYRGALKITLNQDGLLMTNIIPIEEYLFGMIAGEMSPQWNLEALKAQVVAARTYAMYMVNHPRHPLYDLEKGTADQVYPGAGSESEQIRTAVETTRGQFITKNQKPIKTYYHSRCGGSTEPAHQVWNKTEKNSPTSVPCPYCQKFPYTWKTKVKISNLISLLKLPVEKRETFKIALLNRTSTGRVKELSIETDASKHLINSESLRHLLGYAQVKSTRFEVNVDDDEVSFEGVGSGHGVGMCQWGAQFLAKQGKTYKQILAHYYPNFQLHQPNSSP